MEQTSVKFFNRNWYTLIQENAFENVVCKMEAILSPIQCVKLIHLLAIGRRGYDYVIFKYILVIDILSISYELAIRWMHAAGPFAWKVNINWFSQCLGVNREQASTWTNVDKVVRCHLASPMGIESMNHNIYRE